MADSENKPELEQNETAAEEPLVEGVSEEVAAGGWRVYGAGGATE